MIKTTDMSSILKKARTAKASELLKKPAGKFEPCDLSTASFVPKGMTRAFRNNRYTVMIYDNILTTKGFAIKAMVQNHFDTIIPNHWRELQNIKNEIFGTDVTAVEYYPAESKLVDVHNIYWLFIYPEDIMPVIL